MNWFLSANSSTQKRLNYSKVADESLPFSGKSKSCPWIHRYLRYTMAKETSFWKRWSKPYRLTILEERSFKERWEISISRFGVALTLGTVVFLVAASVYALVAWTPLKEFVVPGYASENSRLRAIQAEMTADSAIKQLAIQGEYLQTLSTLLQGEVVERSVEAPEESGTDGGQPLADWGLTQEELDLRSRVEEEDRFALQRGQMNETTLRNIPFAPIQGSISSKFNPAIGHFGVDFVAPEGSVIHAVDDGIVVIASYTSDGGYVISVQHPSNRTSVYKHNKSLLVEVGDRVQAGDPIAILGGTGTHSTGPHSHFEWWVDGQPLDPTQWLPEQLEDVSLSE
jgi:murein DD-endopeptidase MepM/ murein hydrolase activator NlpD